MNDYWSNPAYRNWWNLKGKYEDEICDICGEYLEDCKCNKYKNKEAKNGKSKS